MRASRISVAVLIILASMIFANSFYIKTVTEGFIKEAESIDTENAIDSLESFEGLFRKFKRAERFISVTVSHEDLTRVEESFADIIGAATADDKNALTTAKSRLIDSLGHLRRLSGISLDSII